MEKKKKFINQKNPEGEDTWLRKNIYAVIIFAFSFFLYANSIFNNYNLDDELVTRNHPLTSQGISAIPKVFTSAYYSNAMGYSYGYRPLVLVSFAVEHQLFGDNPHISHFFNVLLYALLCVLIFKGLQILLAGQMSLVPFAAALLFAAHPVHTEVVASIKNRDEILAFIFIMLSWLVLLKDEGRSLFIKIPLSCLWFFAALLAKPTFFSFAIIIPISALLLQRLSFMTAMALALGYAVMVVSLMGEYSLNDKLLVLGSSVVSIMAVGSLWYLNVILRTIRIIIRQLKSFLYLLASSLYAGARYLQRYLYVYRNVFYLLLVAIPFIICACHKFTYGYQVPVYVSLLGAALLFVLLNDIEKLVAFIIFESSLFAIEQFLGAADSIPSKTNFLLLVILFRAGSRPFRITFGLIFLLQLISQFFIEGPGTFILPLAIIAVYTLAIGKWKQKKYDLYLFCIVTFVIAGIVIYKLFAHHQFDYELLVIIAFWDWAIFCNHKKNHAEKVQWSIWYVVAATILFTVISDLQTRSQGKTILRFVTSISAGSKQPRVYYLASLLSVLSPDTSDTPEKSVATHKAFNLPSIAPETFNRPLDFVEVPVRKFDPMPEKLASAFDVLFRYLKLCLIPYPLSFYYGYKVIAPVTFSDPEVIAGIITHTLLLLLLAWGIWKHKTVLVLALIIYLVSIVTFTNIFQSIPGMMADRYLLAPSLGFCMLAAMILARWIKPVQLENINIAELNPWVKYGFLSLLLAYSYITVSRNLDWRDDLTLFRHDVKYVDQSSQAHNLLATHLAIAAQNTSDMMEQKILREEAVVQFRKSIEIYPAFFNPTYDLARTWLDLNDPDSAMFYFKKALPLDSTFSGVHRYIGNLLAAQQKYEEALPYFKFMVEQHPKDYDGYDKLSLLYFKLKQYDEALDVNREAVRRMPGNYLPYFNLGRTYLGMNRSDSAMFYLQQAFSINPNDPQLKAALKQVGAKQ